MPYYEKEMIFMMLMFFTIVGLIVTIIKFVLKLKKLVPKFIKGVQDRQNGKPVRKNVKIKGSK